MTLDELINQLNKIKEVYPDSGKWLITYLNENERIKAERVKVILGLNKIGIE